MFKVKAKARIVFDHKTYEVGEELELSKEQMEYLQDYVEVIEEVKEDQKGSDKPKQASSKGKGKK